jgi:dolichol kinase
MTGMSNLAEDEKEPLSIEENPKSGDSSYNNNMRRWFHLITISILALVYGLSSLTWQAVLFPLGVTSLFVIGFDLLRLHISHLNWLVQNSFDFILRKHEFHSLSGTSWFLIAAIICIIIFPKIAVTIGFLYLAFGDPTASYVGIKWGSKGVGNKTWIGSLGFFLVCTAIGFPCILLMTTWKKALIIAVVPALVSAIVERNLREMDDNLAIPITATALLALLMVILI